MHIHMCVNIYIYVFKDIYFSLCVNIYIYTQREIYRLFKSMRETLRYIGFRDPNHRQIKHSQRRDECSMPVFHKVYVNSCDVSKDMQMLSKNYLLRGRSFHGAGRQKLKFKMSKTIGLDKSKYQREVKYIEMKPTI